MFSSTCHLLLAPSLAFSLAFSLASLIALNFHLQMLVLVEIVRNLGGKI